MTAGVPVIVADVRQRQRRRTAFEFVRMIAVLIVCVVLAFTAWRADQADAKADRLQDRLATAQTELVDEIRTNRQVGVDITRLQCRSLRALDGDDPNCIQLLGPE